MSQLRTRCPEISGTYSKTHLASGRIIPRSIVGDVSSLIFRRRTSRWRARRSLRDRLHGLCRLRLYDPVNLRSVGMPPQRFRLTRQHSTVDQKTTKKSVTIFLPGGLTRQSVDLRWHRSPNACADCWHRQRHSTLQVPPLPTGPDRSGSRTA